MVLACETLTVPARGWRIDPRKALAVSAACWLGFAAVAGAVLTGRSGGIDSAGLLFWRGSDLKPLGPPWLLEGVLDLTALGSVLLRYLFTFGAVVALLFLRLRREAALLVLTVAGALIVERTVKELVGRPRPAIVPHLTNAGGNSFPSGHSFNAAAVYIAIALVFATLSARQTVRITIIAAALVVSFAIAWSRVWLGVHFPSDAIAGWLGGAGWAFLASAMLHGPAGAAAGQLSRSGQVGG